MKKGYWIAIVIVLIALGVYWFMQSRKTEEVKTTTEEETAQLVTPKYIEQMLECEEMGGTIETMEDESKGYEEIEKWKCVCEEGETFADNLECNIWYEPEA